MKQTDAFIYKIAARTEAAGKYDSGAPREGNEDSFAIIPNVGNIEAAVSFDTFSSIPEKGVLMVVADGMGGHNAGEVASQIAVNTVKEMFSSTAASGKDFSSRKSRAQYLEKIVKLADQNIRSDAEANSDRKGMGSTIIMAWIVGDELTVTWCGDSRAYLYHRDIGLEMLSEDHSMVQDMVRKKQLKYEETFSHPQGNIITHCLGGGGKGNAEPETRQFSLKDGDLIMLCSDSLSGVLFDDGRLRPNGEPYSEENLQDILSRKRDCLKDTLTCLFDAARRCGWYDNVTAVLLEFKTNNEEQDGGLALAGPVHRQHNKKRWWRNNKCFLFLAAIAIIIVLLFLVGKISHPNASVAENSEEGAVDASTASAGTEGALAEPPIADNTVAVAGAVDITHESGAGTTMEAPNQQKAAQKVEGQDSDSTPKDTGTGYASSPDSVQSAEEDLTPA